MTSFGEHVRALCTDPRYIFTSGFTAKRSFRLCLMSDKEGASKGSGKDGGKDGAGGQEHGDVAVVKVEGAAGSAAAALPPLFQSQHKPAAHYLMSPTHAPFVPVEFTSTVTTEKAVVGVKSDGKSPVTAVRPVFTVTIMGGTVVGRSVESPRAAWEQVKHAWIGVGW